MKSGLSHQVVHSYTSSSSLIMAKSMVMKPGKINSPVAKSSPFQATKLWNQMIRNFREGIEVKKRRWKMKSYENSFCGHDAVDWLHLYLRSNQKFGDHVTRAQAKMLLQKFFENGIFEDARGKEKRNFEDDNHLYRFTSKAENICKSRTDITSQRSVTNLLRSVSVRRKPPSLMEAACEGERKLIEMKKGAVTRSQSMKCAYLSPRNNAVPPESTRVTPIAQNLELFTINSAEKQFNEKPVDVEPVNGDSEAAKSEAFGEIEQPNFDLSDEETYNSILQDAGIDNRAFIVADMSPFEVAFQRTYSLRDPKAMKYRHKFVVACDEEDAPHEPSFVMNKSIRRTKLKRTKSSKFVTGISYVKGSGQWPSPSKKLKVEENVDEKSCITAALDKGTQDNVERNNNTLGASGKENVENKIDAVPGSYLFERRKSLRPSVKSDTSLRQIRRDKSIRTNSFYNAIEESNIFWKTRVLKGLQNLLKTDYLDDFVNLSVISDHETETNINIELKSVEIPEWTLSAMKFLVDYPDIQIKEKDSDLPKYEGFECDVFRAIVDHYESTLKEPLMTYNMFKLFDISSDIIGKDNSTALKIFQHIFLLIPTWNRKQMYLILRFMDKISKNLLLKLSKDLPNRELVIRSFHRTIIRNKEMNQIDKDQMTSIRIVTFMIDNHEQMLKVPEEFEQFKKVFEERKHSKENTAAIPRKESTNHEAMRRPVSMCLQYRKAEFEKQSVDCTRQALVDLLNMIVNDDTLHPKIKKKRLKEFKKNYPEIYQTKFPEDNVSTCSTTSQRTLRIRQAIRPFFFNKRNTDL